MEKKKASTFIFSIIAIIIGVTLYKQFDFQTFRFEKPGIAIVYLIGFGIAMYVLIKNWRNKQQ